MNPLRGDLTAAVGGAMDDWSETVRPLRRADGTARLVVRSEVYHTAWKTLAGDEFPTRRGKPLRLTLRMCKQRPPRRGDL